MRKVRITALAIASALAFAATAQSGEEIARLAKERNRPSTVQTMSVMRITARDGSVSERSLVNYGTTEGGLSKSVIAFQKPASVADTRFLSRENPGRDADKWIFLPKLGKTRRISGGEGSSSFVGTDFSYDDLSSGERDVAADRHSLKGKETVAGRECWALESIPVDPSDGQYSGTTRWIDTETNVTWKAEMRGKDGKVAKRLEVLEFERAGAYLVPRKTRMSTLAEGTSTEVEIVKSIYDKPIPASVFTERFLSTGRP